MRKIVMYCDRCKKEFEKWNHKKTELYGVAEFVHDDGNPYLDEPKDLCESCYTEFENWWNFTPKAESEPQESEEYEIVDLGNGMFEKRYKTESEVGGLNEDTNRHI